MGCEVTKLEAWAHGRSTSRWRQRARDAMIAALSGCHPDAAQFEKLAAVDAAYPFGKRAHYPYKAWLAERSLLIEALTPDPVMPSKDEADVCEVARDLVEMGRREEARALVEREAPNRLARRCPSCASSAQVPCVEMVVDQPAMLTWHWENMDVPHHARLVGHRDAGLLFERRVICPRCKCETDPDVCHCGTMTKDHTVSDGHSPVPMGCECHHTDYTGGL